MQGEGNCLLTSVKKNVKIIGSNIVVFCLLITTSVTS